MESAWPEPGLASRDLLGAIGLVERGIGLLEPENLPIAAFIEVEESVAALTSR